MGALLVAAMLSGCNATATEAAGGRPAGVEKEAAGDWPAGVKEAEVYSAVLRRFLGNSSENTFPEMTFPTVYVLDRDDAGGPIAANTREQLTAALAGVTSVQFIADRESVLETVDGCPRVRNGGLLIELGRVQGDDNEVTVYVNGFVACLGASMLTYVVRHNDPGPGWTVTGTTGPRAVA
ncbi:hypothetical protein ACQP00_27315 [Dactylosporangium sp. CS-047395]|uniref:hypothetical protein n=1 Tax=Dactylosporangium sp. CS-047395 TaxID=3239936 RepID=UPI003D90AF87